MIGTLLGFVLKDIARSKWVLFYLLFFFVVTEGLLYFTAGEAKTIIGLMNIVLLLIPLAAVMFGTLHIHHSREFIELMLSQPVRRNTIYTALYLGVVLPFLGAFTLGTAIPMAMHGLLGAPTLLTLLISGNVLTLVFFALAFVVAIAANDKASSMGAAFVLWLVMAVLYDGIILAVTVWFADYPLEMATIVMVLLDPVDLARILVMLSFDYAALMGYTGAVFNDFFGSATGTLIAACSLAVWVIAPYLIGRRLFARKDW